MTKRQKKAREISRRKFLKNAGIAAGGVAAIGMTGVLASCTKEVEVTQKITETVTVPPASVELEVYDPTGAIEITQLHAPRLDTLEGKTICELAVGGAWQWERTFPLIRDLLQNQFSTATFIPHTEFPIGVNMPDQETLDLLKEQGCDAVIIGNAG
jgi:hypothetical protein